MANYEPLTCPFCNENDFDAIGLKLHLLKGWCPPFEDTDTDWKRPIVRLAPETSVAPPPRISSLSGQHDENCPCWDCTRKQFRV